MAIAGRQPTNSLRGAWERTEAPVATLVAASLIVGLAIATSGAVSKGINGAGGVLWVVAAVSLGLRLRGSDRWVRNGVTAFAMTLALVLLVKPTDALWAAAGFTIGGALLGSIVRTRRLEWAGFMAAIWLPTHLLVAATRVIERSIRDLPSNVRTDPPPTAALVPFVMVIFALLGACLVERFRAKQNPAG